MGGAGLSKFLDRGPSVVAAVLCSSGGNEDDPCFRPTGQFDEAPVDLVIQTTAARCDDGTAGRSDTWTLTTLCGGAGRQDDSGKDERSERRDDPQRPRYPDVICRPCSSHVRVLTRGMVGDIVNGREFRHGLAEHALDALAERHA